MIYEWSNKARLKTLKASGSGDRIIFEAPGERAEVYLKNDVIDKVIFIATGKSAVAVSAENAHTIVVGKGNAERDVCHYLKPNGPAPTMRLGMTIHRGEGSWSSLPHAFEINTEPGFEEVFFYILRGSNKRGIQVGRGVWCDNSPVDTIWSINDHTFGAVPMGYHPVVGEPGVAVSYIWAYLAKKKTWEKLR
jgi:5-deoxy-D-glucuronate isomerase